MSDEATIQAIQERMREVRRELRHDLAASARDITDWKSYIRAQPWLAVAGAAAIGYLLAPKGPPVVRLSSVDLQQFARQGEATASVRMPQPKKESLTKKVFAVLMGLAAKNAMAYITHQLTSSSRGNPSREESRSSY